MTWTVRTLDLGAVELNRRRMIATRAADNLAVVAYVNLVGGQDEVIFDGGSLVIDEHGAIAMRVALAMRAAA